MNIIDSSLVVFLPSSEDSAIIGIPHIYGRKVLWMSLGVERLPGMYDCTIRKIECRINWISPTPLPQVQVREECVRRRTVLVD
jgi:hypothetical protein